MMMWERTGISSMFLLKETWVEYKENVGSNWDKLFKKLSKGGTRKFYKLSGWNWIDGKELGK